MPDLIKTGSSQEAFRKFCRCVDSRTLKSQARPSWPPEFPSHTTDFDRVNCLLTKIYTDREDRHGIGVFGLPTKASISKANSKSDVASNDLRQQGNKLWEVRECQDALQLFTAAIFNASTDAVKALALGNRSCVLFYLKCYEEARIDANDALMLGFPEDKAARLHIRIGQCCLQLNGLRKARDHFQRAIDLTTDRGNLSTLARQGLAQCQEATSSCGATNNPPWMCVRSSSPVVSTATTQESPRLIAAPSGAVRLKNFGSLGGWSLELTRDVSIKEVLIIDTPYTSRLKKDGFLSHCFQCYRRCINLKPCPGCCQVGFCSDACSEEATRVGEGRHCHDCEGLLPCLLLDNYAGWPRSSSESIGGADVAHLAYACVADTPPQTLLDYICQTGRYQDGPRHQAFVGTITREKPPAVYDPSDYSSAAWLVANSEKRSVADLWQRTVAAVFLTYCLSLSGYPMAWFDDESPPSGGPSPRNRPECAPARWIAATILYHLQAVPSNAHTFAETTLPGNMDFRHSEIRQIASCLYPTLSLVNHSCDPNVTRVCVANGKCFLTPLRPLRAGQEILDCYSCHYALQPRNHRQRDLLLQYCFSCACEACLHNWPDLSILCDENNVNIRCFDCKGVASVSNFACPKCGSEKSRKTYENRIETELPSRLKSVEISSGREENLEWARGLLEQMAGLGVSRPAKAWDMAQEFYKVFLTMNHGNWCLEPASTTTDSAI